MKRRTVLIALPLLTALLLAVLATPIVRWSVELGHVPIRLQDDGAYFSRIQTALLGRSGPYENGITGPPFEIRAAGPGLLEFTEGTLFSWTPLSGVEIGTLVMLLLAPLFLPLFYLLLRDSSVRPPIALLLSTLLSAALIGVLSRPHLGVLLPLMVLTLTCVHRIAVRPTWILIPVAAVLLALLPSLYFWVWTFTWAACGFIFLLRWHVRDETRTRALRFLAIAGGLGLLLSIPGLLSTWVLQMADPTFQEMALYRSGLYPSHAIASPIRSTLQLLALVPVAVLFWKIPRERRSLLLPLAFVAGGFVVTHQHVIHGKDFLSSSHYEPMVTIAAATCIASLIDAWLRKGIAQMFSWPSIIALVASGILLAAAAWDYGLGWRFLVINPPPPILSRSAIEPITDLGRVTILTDPVTAIELKSRTPADVVFTPYVQHIVVSNAEFAARGCMAELFQPGGADVELLAWHTLQFRGQHMLPERTAEFRRVCDNVLQNPLLSMLHYQVDLILWNERERPEWVMDPAIAERVEQGDGWSLWRPRW